MSGNSSGHDNIFAKAKVKRREVKVRRGPDGETGVVFSQGCLAVSEFEEAWARVLAEAQERARRSGHGDVADYLALRATNDLARQAGVDWLFSTFTMLAGEVNRQGASVQVSKQDGHRFRVGSATMVGSLLTFRTGVRQLSIEAGWPRAPQDGFIRGGGLALAHVKHFGNRASDEELMLARDAASGAPQWLVLEKTGARTILMEERARRHIARFLGPA